MLATFTGTEEDPITHRMISDRCWNMWHQEEDEVPHKDCSAAGCECTCHDWMKP
jgi:hypothetical protein